MVNMTSQDGGSYYSMGLNAMQAMLSGQEVTAHFAVAPFQYYELAVPGVRAVLLAENRDKARLFK